MRDDDDAVRGARGGNSWRSIPAGADVHPGYVVDSWPEDDPASLPSTSDSEIALQADEQHTP